MKTPRIDAKKARILGGSALGAVLIAVFLIWQANPAIAQIPAKLEILAQKVMARADDKAPWGAATEGMPLPIGTWLKTDATGRAQITYFEGSVSRLDTDTEISITQTGQLEDQAGSSRIKAFQTLGSTWHRVKKLISKKSRYEIQTPTAVAAVRGTTFRVDVRPDGTTTFFVFEGALEIRTEAGDTIMLEAGHKLTIPPGARVSEDDILPLSPADQDAWYVYNMGLDQAMTAAESGASELPTPTPEPSGSGETSPGPAVAPASPSPSPTRRPSSPPPSTPPGRNRSPVLDPVPNVTCYEGTTTAFSLSATDPDGDPLTYSASGMPSGATLGSTTGRFSWKPSYMQAGAYQIRFTASDGRLSASREATITVRNVNRPPVFNPTAPYSVVEGQLLTFVVTASDADGNPLTYSAAGLPPGATFAPATRTFSWLPLIGQAGTHAITLSVTDGTDTVSRTVSIAVSAFPLAAGPGVIACRATVGSVIVASLAPRTVESGTRFLVVAEFSDRDGMLAGGGAATVGLPEGLALVGAPATVVLAPARDGATSAVAWPVRALRPGAYVVTVVAQAPGAEPADLGSSSRIVTVSDVGPITLLERILSFIPGLRR